MLKIIRKIEQIILAATTRKFYIKKITLIPTVIVKKWSNTITCYNCKKSRNINIITSSA